MIYLIAQVVFASLFTLVIKWAQVRGKDDVITIGCINYITAAILILPSWLSRNPEPGQGEAFTGAMVAGGAMGGVYFIAYFFVIVIIRWVGASAASVVSVLSILLPITFAAFYWGDQPNLFQMIGIGLALVSLLLIGSSRQKPNRVTDDNSELALENQAPPIRPWFAPIVLLVFFLLCGCSRIAQEAFKNVSVPEERTTFLLAAFVVASIPSAGFLVWKFLRSEKKFVWTELVFGLMMGTSNILQTYFILKCLEHFAGFIVFPVTSAGSILFTTFAVVAFLGERLTSKSYVGIAIACVALFLLNWIPN